MTTTFYGNIRASSTELHIPDIFECFVLNIQNFSYILWYGILGLFLASLLHDVVQSASGDDYATAIIEVNLQYAGISLSPPFIVVWRLN